MLQEAPGWARLASQGGDTGSNPVGTTALTSQCSKQRRNLVRRLDPPTAHHFDLVDEVHMPPRPGPPQGLRTRVLRSEPHGPFDTNSRWDEDAVAGSSRA
jgi:hypothetical protein